MEPSVSIETSDDVVLSLRDDKEALLEQGMELTLNQKGFAEHLFGPPEEHWLSSLPNSNLPLLDAGACYGFQTISALKSGRDVIALDMSEEHISVLHDRVAKLDNPGVGRLVRTIIAQLPDPDIIAEASVSGILSSHVIHFYRPGQLRPQFKHFYQWLAPGGKLVVKAGSGPPRIYDLVENKGVNLPDERTPKDVLEMVENLSPSELVDATPGLVFSSDESPWKDIFGDFMYLMSTVELRELAESSGFVVEDVRYCHSQKYENEKSEKDIDDIVWLVARKPLQIVS